MEAYHEVLNVDLAYRYFGRKWIRGASCLGRREGRLVHPPRALLGYDYRILALQRSVWRLLRWL